MTRLAETRSAYCASFAPVVETGCWEWTGSRKGKRYAQVTGEKKLLHRVLYEEYYGPIPDGLVIDHLCRNTWCVNPEHLEAVTHRENCRRGNSTKLSEEQRQMIRESTAQSHLIAAEFGVSAGHVRRLRGPLKNKGIMRKGVR